MPLPPRQMALVKLEGAALWLRLLPPSLFILDYCNLLLWTRHYRRQAAAHFNLHVPRVGACLLPSTAVDRGP